MKWKPNRSKRKFGQCLLVLAIAAAAVPAQSAAPQILDVVNYGSRMGTGLPDSGIAQGALFAVTGAGLGPSDSPVTANFPLPTSDGLGGVTITITASGGSSSNAILVFASANEVDAILPSAIPTGAATVTLNYNGASASFKINVVASAFGIIASAGFYNLNADGSVTLNSPYSPAVPGQTVYVTGTGLGAIASDETQPGATDASNAAISLWVGSTQATVTSAGRGACCNGGSPSAALPAGLSAIDVIAFTVPDSTDGCQVSVAIQIGAIVSNIATFASAANGSTCPEAASVNGGNPVTISGTARIGVILMLKSTTAQNAGGVTLNTTIDAGTASFNQVDYSGQTVNIPPYSALLSSSAGSCTAYATRFDKTVIIKIPPPTGGPQPTPLDAGPQLTVTAGKVTEALKKTSAAYAGNTTLTSVQAIPGLPPTVTGGPDFLPGGPYQLDNGGGGKDIPAFKVNPRNPTPVNWDSMAKNQTIDRSKGVLVTWSGGDADGILVITGLSSSQQGNVTYAGSFTCYAKAAWGQFQVPSYITSVLPPSGTLATGGFGSMTLGGMVVDTPSIPTIDLTYYNSQQVNGTQAVFQ